MDMKNVISGLKYTIEMFLFDPATGYTKDPDNLNAADRITFDACKGAIDLLKEQEQGWVPVRERLPEERHSVLVYCPEYRNIFCAYYYKDAWLFFGGRHERIDEKVSHWMVLPESPIEDGGDGE